MKKLTLVKVEWLKHRDRLKARIDEIGAIANNPELYTDIDKACSNEWAFLFLAFDDFVILQPRYQRQTTYLDVTVAYSTKGNAILNYMPLLTMLAKKGAAQFLRFYSVRKGFDKVAPKHDWQKVGYHRNLAIWRYKL